MFIQDYLRSKSGEPNEILTALQAEYGIKNNCHEDGRVILNYDQIESYEHKTNPMVMECRGLVLNRFDNWSLVARAFPRFFNLGEDVEGQKEFNWESCIGTSKEDGSLLIVYYWNGQWRVNTRNSYAEGLVNGGELTWRQLAEKAIVNTQHLNWKLSEYSHWENLFYQNCCYVLELCSPYNKIVRAYGQPTVYLLSVFIQGCEQTWSGVKAEGQRIGIPAVQEFKFDDHYEVVNHINTVSQTDKTWEGVVLRDKNNFRIKVKSATYVELHRLADNGNVARPDRLIKFVLAGEQDEVLTYFPDLEELITEMTITVNASIWAMNTIWEQTKNLESQKEFALAVKDFSYAPFLFNARKTGRNPEEIFRSEPDLVLKKLFGG